MTNSSTASISRINSYSLALYELGSEKNCLEEIEKQVSELFFLINDKEFNYIIKNPINKQDDQLKIVNIISERFNFNELLKKFLIFLVIKRRLFYLGEILKDFKSICSKQRGEILAKLTSAKELEANEIKILKSELSKDFGSNVILNYKYDPSLIGGLVIQVGSLMIDTSIKSKLLQIENKMIEA